MIRFQNFFQRLKVKTCLHRIFNSTRLRNLGNYPSVAFTCMVKLRDILSTDSKLRTILNVTICKHREVLLKTANEDCCSTHTFRTASTVFKVRTTDNATGTTSLDPPAIRNSEPNYENCLHEMAAKMRNENKLMCKSVSLLIG